jgi:hypothetical protein
VSEAKEYVRARNVMNLCMMLMALRWARWWKHYFLGNAPI